MTDRREPRKRVFYSGTLEVRGQVLPCRIRDLSAFGALIDLDVPVWTGYDAVLDVPKVGRAGGTIAWSQANRAGLAFEIPLSLEGLGQIAEPDSTVGTLDATGLKRWTIKQLGAQTRAQERSRDAVAALRARPTRWKD